MYLQRSNEDENEIKHFSAALSSGITSLNVVETFKNLVVSAKTALQNKNKANKTPLFSTECKLRRSQSLVIFKCLTKV